MASGDDPALSAIRRRIDRLDAAMLPLFARRRALVAEAERIKRDAGLPLRDREREHAVLERSRRQAEALGIPTGAAQALSRWLIGDACELQGITDGDSPSTARNPPMTVLPPPAAASLDGASPWLRLLPPPRRLAPLLRLVPPTVPAMLLQRVLLQVLAQALSSGALEPIHGRRVGIRVEDLGIGWTVEVDAARVRVAAGIEQAEAGVHGSLTDLLLLASRQQDADTLFFQRRLQLTGDVELGLTARNLLDQLPWEQLPLAARILLHRLARFTQAARAAHATARGNRP
jgi:O2-independent ubiquinone biosynthesis accessory factor UbiT